jgi:hypothetical protein
MPKASSRDQSPRDVRECEGQTFDEKLDRYVVIKVNQELKRELRRG